MNPEELYYFKSAINNFINESKILFGEDVVQEDNPYLQESQAIVRAGDDKYFLTYNIISKNPDVRVRIFKIPSVKETMSFIEGLPTDMAEDIEKPIITTNGLIAFMKSKQ